MPDRTELAEHRTDWAEDRTLLANERTLASWIRAGLTSCAVGLGFQAVFDAYEPVWVAKSGATLFVLAGVVAFLTGRWRARCVSRELEAHSVKKRSWLVNDSLIAVLTLAALSIVWVLWTL